MNILLNRYLGKLCKRGHDWNGTGKSLRDKNNRTCYECEKMISTKYKQLHKIEMKIYLKKYRHNHIDEVKNWGKEYRQLHKIERNENKRKRRKKDLKFRLNLNISTAIYFSLKGNKNGRHWEELVGYTLMELKSHLEKTIPDEYTWQDYLNGKLHVDHIIPISVFNFSEATHLDFKRCWALKNLQLLPAIENLKKQNKLNTAFQISLVI